MWMVWTIISLQGFKVSHHFISLPCTCIYQSHMYESMYILWHISHIHIHVHTYTYTCTYTYTIHVYICIYIYTYIILHHDSYLCVCSGLSDPCDIAAMSGALSSPGAGGELSWWRGIPGWIPLVNQHHHWKLPLNSGLIVTAQFNSIRELVSWLLVLDSGLIVINNEYIVDI